MNVARMRIEGSNLDLMVAQLQGKLRDSHVYRSDSTVVVAAEKFYFRLEGNLMTVIIINTALKDTYDVEVVTGGGGHGPFGWTWGAERHSSGRIVRILEEICASNSWLLTKEP
jgi:hypothetical protein